MLGGVERIPIWSKEQPFGAELARVRFDRDRLSARGVALGVEPGPYRLDYELETVAGFVTARLWARAEGAGWHRSLDLRRAADGTWTAEADGAGAPFLGAPGGDLGVVYGAMDCDLGLSPLTNSMPVLRHGLQHAGGPVDFLMAWVAVPGLTVHPSAQRYAFVGRQDAASVVAYQSGTFGAELIFDPDGLVLRYPGLATKMA